jgi:GPH family glycoside/pentoside/hexuronide:cation symporter
LENQDKQQLTSRNLWGYAIGAIPNGLLVFIFLLKYIQLFYDKLQLAPTLFVIGQVIYLIVNALNDPLLGQMSDRTNSKKWGSRRTIYIRYGAPIWGFTFMLVWVPWSFTNQIVIFLHFIISICLFDTFFTLVVLVWMALLPEMTSDLDERNKANLLATIVAAVFVLPMFIIVGAMDPTSETFIVLMLFVAILSTILLVITSYLCKERREFQMDKGLPLPKAVKETLKMKSFLLYMGYNFCQSLIGSIGLSYLFVYLLVLGEGGLFYYFGIFFFIGYGSNFLFVKMRAKWGMRNSLLRFGFTNVIITLILFPFIVLINVPLLVILTLTIRTFLGGYSVFNTPFLYLSIDEDELKTGSRREGMFLGINALITKPAQSFGPIIATFILGIFGYIQNSSFQPDSALIGVKILMFLFPVIVDAIGLTFMYFYPLHGENLDQLREKLQTLHVEKRERIK